MKIGFIDPYMETPAIHSFNEIVELFQDQVFYYPPSKFPPKGLIELKNKCDAYMIVGSASHVTEELPWHRPLFEFLWGELQRQKPILGCCFGHQLMSHGLGGEVNYFSKDQQKIKGVRKIQITKDWGPFKKEEDFYLAVSHKQVVKKKPFDLIEIGVGFENDLLAHPTLPLLITQAHPEISQNGISDDEIYLESDLLLRGDGKKMIKRFFDYFWQSGQ
jgi:GMP synthase-like glutamine amidotransferase